MNHTTDSITIKSKTIRIAKKMHVTFSFDDKRFNAEWSTDKAPAALPNRLYKRYEAARNDFMSEVANQLGGSVVMINADGSHAVIDKPEVH